jgi:DNA-directed RNA polymerase specialized sigma24 family protein
MTDGRDAAARDADAYEALVLTHADRVWAAALAVTGDPVAAQDAARDAFVEAWRALPAPAEPAGFGASIRQLATRRARDLVRAGRPVDDPGAEGDARIRAALSRLSEEAREVVVRHLRDRTPAPELAADLGLTPSTVADHLGAAEQVLGDELVPLTAALRQSGPNPAFLLAVSDAVRAAPQAGPAPRPWGRRALGVLFGVPVVVGLARLLGGPSAPSGETRPTAASTTEAAPPPPSGPSIAPEEAADEAFAALAAVTGLRVVRCPAGGLPPDPVGPDELRVVGDRAWFLTARPAGRVEVWPAPSIRRVTAAEAAAAPPAPEPPTVLQWDPEGCVVERPAPGAGGTEPRPAPAVEDLLAEALAGSLGAEDPISRALARPGLSRPATQLLESWRRADLEATEELFRALDALPTDEGAP